jgi:hypothetical protein
MPELKYAYLDLSTIEKLQKLGNNSGIDDLLDLLVAALSQMGNGPAGVGCRY